MNKVQVRALTIVMIFLASLFATLVVGFFIGAITFGGAPQTAPELKSNSTEGVALHGCVTRRGENISDGWLQNNNDYPVRVREVYNNGTGESTQTMKLLVPGEKLALGYVSSSNSFYIYTKEGGLIGWLSSYCQTG